jgi:hypothetical protein
MAGGTTRLERRVHLVREMNDVKMLGALALLAACGGSQASAPAQQPVPGTRAQGGVTAQQTVADDEIVERIASARCDRDESCNRVGPGAPYRNRSDCMQQTRELVKTDLNPATCRGGVGAVSLDRCVQSLEEGQCDMPGQIAGRTSQCDLTTLCMKH